MHLDKKKIYNWLRYLIGILIIYLLLKNIDFNKVIDTFAKSDPSWIFIGFLIFIFTTIIVAYGLMVLFRSAVDIRFLELMKYYLMTHSVSMILPGKIGQMSMAYFIRDKGVNIGQSTAILIVDKLISVIVFGVITIVGLLLMSEEIYGDIGILLLIVIILVILGTVFIFSKYSQKLISFIFGKYNIYFSDFFITLVNLIRNHKSKVAINSLVTIVRPILNGLLILILFRSLGYNVGLIYATLVSSLTIIASIIPITPNGVGVREGVGVFLFSRINLPLEVSLSMYFMIFVFNTLLSLVGGLVYLTHKKN
jgi:uncharacterized protein (TIRG00374 family)